MSALPDGVAGNVVEAGELVARELVGEGEDALRGQVPPVLVHRGEGGDHLVHERDLGVRGRHPVLCRPRGVRPFRCRRTRHGVHQLPQKRRPIGRVTRQQLVERVVPDRPRPVTTIGPRTTSSPMVGSWRHRSIRRKRFWRISCSSARARIRPARCSSASSSRAVHRRSIGSRNQLSPTSWRPVAERAPSNRSSARNDTIDRPSSPRPRPNAASFSTHGPRSGGVQPIDGQRRARRSRPAHVLTLC